jgi:hypothetical protein
MERLRANPGAWGVALGSAIALASLFFVWIEVVNRAGDTERFRAISTFTGQTLMFAAILGLIAGAGVAASVSGWRFVFALLALAVGVLLVAAGGWAVLDPVGFTKYAADAQAFASLTSSSAMEGSRASLASAFASGELDASVGIGAVIGLVGGLLVLLGAVLSFRRRAVRAR